MDLTERLKLIYKQVILENAENPRNYGELKDFDYKTTVYNPSCGDKWNLMLKTKDDQITDISFEGEGCTISKASASLMTQLVKEKNVSEAIELSKLFSSIASGHKHSKEEMSKLKDAQVLTNIMEFPARIKCATIAWWGLDRMLLGNEKGE